jgi:hypothetical protein
MQRRAGQSNHTFGDLLASGKIVLAKTFCVEIKNSNYKRAIEQRRTVKLNQRSTASTTHVGPNPPNEEPVRCIHYAALASIIPNYPRFSKVVFSYRHVTLITGLFPVLVFASHFQILLVRKPDTRPECFTI